MQRRLSQFVLLCSLTASPLLAQTATMQAPSQGQAQQQAAPAVQTGQQVITGPVITGPVVTGPVQTGPVPASAPAGGDPQLKQSPLKQLQNFEPAADAEYELGPGDQISLDFPGHPELTGKHIIGPDGRVTLPVAGAVNLNNKTREAAIQTVIDALTPYYTNLNATLSIDKYAANRIIVLGNVKNPGVLEYDGTPTLLDAIARGGMMANASSKDGIPNECMIYRNGEDGSQAVVNVQLRDLLRSGNAASNLRLRRNDIVFIPFQQDQFVSVLGQVLRPGPVPYTSDLTLRAAMTAAGGLAEPAGSSPTIQVVQTSVGKTVKISWKELMTPGGGDEITLHPGDMIFIPKSGMYDFTTAMTKILPIATLITFAAMQ
jgi:polysaccharide biosynthesis/export protein